MLPTLEHLEVLDLVPFGQPSGSNRFFALRLARPSWPVWHPGQFVMLRPECFGLENPLGRPFCICHMTQRHLICFFKVAGKGTNKMASLKAGDKIMAWGPLGNYFAMEEDTPTLLLAGGMGIAPFVGYAHRHPHPWNVSMLFGHRDPLNCFPIDSINERSTVDSLRENEPGDLDNLIYSMQEKIRDCADQNGLVLACGPEPFLLTAQKFAKEYHARMQLSLERRMACGIGACLGCVVKPTHNCKTAASNGNPVQTCLHGPIFWADELEL